MKVLIEVGSPEWNEIIKTTVTAAIIETNKQHKRLSAVQGDEWIDREQAMKMVGIKTRDGMNKFRRKSGVKYSKVSDTHIVYNKASLLKFLEKNSHVD